MRIGILGSGLMGGKLGTIFARAGHDVIFSYSHDERKLKRLAREAQKAADRGDRGAASRRAPRRSRSRTDGTASRPLARGRSATGTARAGTPREAAHGSDVLLLAVHWSRVDDVLRQAGDLTGKILMTCSLPMSSDDSGLVLARTTSGAEALARKSRGAAVVAAFGTVPSEVLFSVFEARGKPHPPSLVYYGDSQKAKRVAVRLIRDAGFEPVDAGPLRIARYAEPFTLLIAQLAYEGQGSSKLAYRIERFRS